MNFNELSIRQNSIKIFALVSFVSIAAGNIFLGITTLFFLLYIYCNGINVNENIKPYFYGIGIFLLAMLLSALGSGDIANGIKKWADMWIWRMMPFLIIVCSMHSYKSIRKVLIFAVIGITVGILCVVYQGVTGDNRAAGFFGHPMTFAGYFCMYLPVFLVGFFEKKITGKYYWLSGIIFLFGCAGVIFNATRGAWLSLGVVVTIILLYYMLQNKYNFIVGVIFVSLTAGILLNNSSFMHRLNTITSHNYQSNTERILMWRSAWNMFKDHPVLGVGLGQYKDSYQKIYISPKAKEPERGHAHSNYFQMLGENGIVGFVGFMAMFGVIICKNLKDFYKNRNPFALMIVASTIALLLQGFTEYNFGNSAVVKAYWLLLGCLVSMKEYSREE